MRAKDAYALNDAEIALKAIIAGIARWEPFGTDPEVGELCFDGIGYFCYLDEEGLPMLSDDTLHQLTRVLREREG
jgi:hypothetical protein